MCLGSRKCVPGACECCLGPGTPIFVGDFQNNGITLEPKVVTLHGNHSYTLEHYYLLIDNEP